MDNIYLLGRFFKKVGWGPHMLVKGQEVYRAGLTLSTPSTRTKSC